MNVLRGKKTVANKRKDQSCGKASFFIFDLNLGSSPVFSSDISIGFNRISRQGLSSCSQL